MQAIKELEKLERLAQRKASVYGRVLTDVELAETMKQLACLHGERAERLSALLGEECKVKTEEGGDEA